MPYQLTAGDQVVEGKTNDKGQTEYIYTSQAQAVKVLTPKRDEPDRYHQHQYDEFGNQVAHQ